MRFVVFPALSVAVTVNFAFFARFDVARSCPLPMVPKHVSTPDNASPQA